MRSRTINDLLRRAKELGINAPEDLQIADLKKAVSLYSRAKDMRKHARAVGVELPQDVVNLGTLERIFLDEVERRLAGIKQNDIVHYSGQDWKVKKISPVSGRPRCRVAYTLYPVDGGRHSVVPDTTLLKAIKL